MTDVPTHGLQIVSTLSDDGTLVIELADNPVPAPGADEVLVRIEGAPINPSDLLTLMPAIDPAEARFEGTVDRPKVVARLSPEAARLRAGRFGQALTVGLEGAGVVIAAGANAQALLGRKVAALSLGRGLYGQYRVFAAAECTVLPDDVSTRQGAALFTNPLTALAIAECARIDGFKGLIHTAAASNLGQMLVRICVEDGLPLVNVVRRQEHVDLLKRLGATHVCNSSLPSFRDDLVEACKATGAMVAFDALGGGTMADDLLAAMEAAAVSRMDYYSPYGSYEFKQVYTYGLLDTRPTTLHHTDYGLLWGMNGFLMPAILDKVGPDRAAELRKRVLDHATTTFASHYTRHVSLAEVLQRDVMIGYHRQATGEKYLINPTL
jgi:NADPH:quinone reductase-like Zn-dependent oxidoreductase